MNTQLRRGSVVLGLALTLALPATAFADPPGVSTGAASGVGQAVATLNGSVNPKKNSTSAFFQVGTSRLYGTNTPTTTVGAGNKAKKITAPVSGLAPFTTYHYRLVAQYGSSNKLRFGADRVFKTDKQPLGLTLSAVPNVVRSGNSTVLSGTLSGTGNAGKQVILQANPWPFPGFATAGNPQVVDANGNFSFPVLHVVVNTYYQVSIPSKPEIASPIVPILVPVKVRMSATKKVKRGHKVTIKGRVTPVVEGAPVAIQRNFRGTWVTVHKTHISDSGAGSSFFKTKFKVKESATYRAVVTPGVPTYIADHSGEHHVKVTRH